MNRPQLCAAGSKDALLWNDACFAESATRAEGQQSLELPWLINDAQYSFDSVRIICLG